MSQQIQIRDYIPDDIIALGKIKQPGIELDKLKEMAILNYQSGPSTTLLVDGKIVACGGFRIIWPGVADIWTILSYDIDRFKTSLIKTYWLCIHEWVKKYNLHRIQCMVDMNYPDGIRLAEYLGLKNETPNGVKKYSSDKKDYYLYAWVKKD